MSIDKKIEASVLKVYDTWLYSYLNGDVKTYDAYLHDDYHFIGSTNNEEFLTRKDTTQFFASTAEQLAGKCDLRNETQTLEQFGELIFITHVFDAWFLNETDYSYYGRFRFSNVLREDKEGWRFIYQHFSTPDSKTEDGETIGFDKINEENQELREAIKRRTFELEQKNRELKVEGALERIRAQAVAMKQSSDLLDIVVTMRNEFIKLGHEAHYFWHMMWLPDKYEKAMTSGDGARIGFVMELPRHIHGDIPLLAKWEKSNKPTVVYAMDAEEAIDYVDKMVALGDFKNIDPQAPTHDDIRHIKGLTFNMARTSHGEIGYSLPGVVKNPPTEDIDILIKFAGAFDLAHQRFLDLQKAEKQAREVQIELALEKVRSRTMAMQHSDELQEASFLLDQQVRALGIKTWGCAFNIHGEKESTEWFGNEAGVLHTYTVPREGIFKDYYQKGQKGESLLIKEFSGKECVKHYEYMSTLPVIGDVLKILKETNKGFPTYQIDHVVYFKYGYLLFITREPVPDAHDIFKRFAKVFEQTYTRFLDLQKAEVQARESQIELGLERLRARAMAMQHSNELSDLVATVLQELTVLDFSLSFCIINMYNEPDQSNTVWAANPDEGKAPESYYMKFEDYPFHNAMMREWKAQTPKFVYVIEGEEKEIYDDYLYEKTEFSRFPKEVQDANRALDRYVASFVFSPFGGLQTVGDQPLSEESLDILYRFGKVFNQTYTRFIDLQKAEAQAREAKIEASLEKVRSVALSLQKADDMLGIAKVLYEQLLELGFSDIRNAIIDIHNDEEETFLDYDYSHDMSSAITKFSFYGDSVIEQQIEKTQSANDAFFEIELKGKDLKELIETRLRNGEKDDPRLRKTDHLTYNLYSFGNGAIGISNFGVLNDEQKKVLKRFRNVFTFAYKRYTDLAKAEAQAREAQIEASLERVRSKAMAMHNSQDIAATVDIFFKELKNLGIMPIRCGVGQIDEKTKTSNVSATTSSKQGDSYEVIGKLKLVGHPVLDTIFDHWQKQEEYYPVLKGKELTGYYKVMNPQVGFPDYSKDVIQYGSYFYFNEGLVYAWTEKQLEEADIKIFRRFTAVIALTYRRYMDLQKAEAQAREAQIEAALEKVRSRSLAMQSGNELQEVVLILVEKLKELGVILDANGITLCTYFQGSKDVLHWIASPDFSFVGKYLLPYFDHPIFRDAWQSKEKGDVYFSKAYSIEEKNSFFEHAFEHSDYKKLPEKFKQWIFQNDQHTLSFAWQKNSAILIPSNTGVLPTETEKAVLIRFSKVFEHAYIRFLDLKVKQEQSAELLAEKKRLEKTLSNLQETQKQLIQSEKMASLGELTAGIAHEIQNPLNFVNNFSEVSNELLEDMNEELEKGNLEEVKHIANDVKQNLEKINHHGRRADTIVKGMLQHSRTRTAEKEPTDINKLADEYLRLAYHGLRAKDKNFNANLETNFDDEIGLVQVIPQDMGRVILNLITNAFYACAERGRSACNERRNLAKEKDYQPTVSISTSSLEGGKGGVTISIKDNGNGIPKQVVDKIFQPFFTTKPTGKGTGLGLSMSYDIVKAHGGKITVETEEGKGTTFSVLLPATKKHKNL